MDLAEEPATRKAECNPNVIDENELDVKTW